MMRNLSRLGPVRAAVFLLAALTLSTARPGARVAPIQSKDITYILPVYLGYQGASDADFAAQVTKLRTRIGEGNYVKVGFSTYINVPVNVWNVDVTDPTAVRAALAVTTTQIDAVLARARANNIPVNLLITRTRTLEAQTGVINGAEAADRRNVQWFADNSTAEGWMTKSRYARGSSYGAVEAVYMQALGQFIANRMADPLNAGILVAASGDGELELSPQKSPIDDANTYTDQTMLLADYSPFAIAEFRDWLTASGLYATGQPFAGQAYAQASLYTGNLAALNAAFGTDFDTFHLKYFDWDLNNEDGSRITGTVNPLQISNAHGFDAPRVPAPASPWWQMWLQFRQQMLYRHNLDFAKQLTTSVDPQFSATIPATQWYSYQIPADYVYESDPVSNPNLRFITSGSAFSTGDMTPFGGLGITAFNLDWGPDFASRNIPQQYFRTLASVAPHIAPRNLRFALLEWAPSAWWAPGSTTNPQNQADLQDPTMYRADMNLVEQYHPSVIDPWALDAPDTAPFYGTAFETELHALVTRISGGTATAIVTQPASQTVAAPGQVATFAATASGNPAPTYQWQVSTGGAFSNLSDTGVYTGTATSTLIVTNPSASLTGTRYQLIATNAPNGTTGSVTSNAATLTVLGNGTSNPEMSLDVPADGATVGQGFTIAGWAFDRGANAGTGVDMVEVSATPGAGQAPIVFTPAALIPRTDVQSAKGLNATAVNSGYFVVARQLNPGTYQITVRAHSAVTGTFVLSKTITVTLTGTRGDLVPAISTHPGAQTKTVGQTATFSVTAAAASGQPALAYQWQVSTDGVNWADLTSNSTYSGVNGTTLTVANVSGALSASRYRAIVASGFRTATSNMATLTVTAPQNGQSTPLLFIDHPGNGTTVGQPFTVDGWAIDSGSGAGTGIDQVSVYATTGSVQTLLGVATYGGARADISGPPGNFGPQFLNSAYTFTVSGLALGHYTFAVFAHSTLSGQFATATTTVDIVTPGCAAGSFSPNFPTVACTPAPAGSFVANAGATSATLCPLGTFSASTGATACTPAPVGKFVGSTGATAASLCAAGTFSATTGSSSCTNAPAGSFVATTGAIASQLCAAGTFSATPGATSCSACAAGTTSGAGATVCSAKPSDPAMFIDAPADGATNVSQPFPISGWTIDKSASSGTGIDSVNVTAILNPGAGQTSFNLGSAAYGGARSDIGTVYGAQFANSAFSLSASGLAAGHYEIVVTPHSLVSGANVAGMRIAIDVAAGPAAPTITLQPANTTITTGGTATFTVGATGSPTPTVQWQISTNGGTSFSNLTNGAPYSGVTTATLTVTSPSASLSGAKYRAVVTNSQGPATSGAATLTVNAVSTPTIFLDTPSPGATVSQPFTIGGWAIDLVAGSGTGVDAVQVTAVPNPGSGQAAIALGAATYGNPRIDVGNDHGHQFDNSGFTLSASGLAAGHYQILVTMHSLVSGASAGTASATIDVTAAPAAPTITTAPANATISTGGTATFTVTATGSPTPTVQWQISTNGGTSFSNLTNGAPYSGVTTATLTVTSPSASLSGAEYRAVATNSQGPATSAAATLTVNAVSALVMFLDTPSTGATVGQPFPIGGWAFDLGATTGTGVAAVTVAAFPNPGSGQAPIALGTATYGGLRVDVGNDHGHQFDNCGFTLNASGLAAGHYQIVVTAQSALSGTTTLTASTVVDVSAGPVGVPLMVIDAPTPGAISAQPLLLSGWAIDRASPSGTGIDAVQVSALPSGGAPITLGAATFVTRTDVGAAYGAQFTNAGFTFNVTGLATGAYTLVVSAHSTVTGTNTVRTVAITIPTSASRPQMFLDAPAPNATVSASFIVAGWALDQAAPSGSGVDGVDIFAAPLTGGTPGTATLVGHSAGNGARPDLVSRFGSQFTNAGFVVSVAGLAAGPYRITAQAHSTVTGAALFALSADITVSAAPVSLPGMNVDGPLAGATATQPFTVRGWAIDLGETSGTGVDIVQVAVFAVVGGTPAPTATTTVTTTYGGPRPDVGTALSLHQFDACGFTTSVSGLAPGTYDLVVSAHSTVAGTFNQSRTVRVIVQ